MNSQVFGDLVKGQQAPQLCRQAGPEFCYLFPDGLKVITYGGPDLFPDHLPEVVVEAGAVHAASFFFIAESSSRTTKS